MNSWRIRMPSKWNKYIERQDPTVQVLIKDILKLIASNPLENDGIVQQYKPNKVYKRRAGDYRILYMILKKIKIIDIVKIGHRKNVYE